MLCYVSALGGPAGALPSRAGMNFPDWCADYTSAINRVINFDKELKHKASVVVNWEAGVRPAQCDRSVAHLLGC